MEKNMGYIDPQGQYYEGDRQGNDQEVPQRPGPDYTWSGSAWEIPLASAQTAQIAQMYEDYANAIAQPVAYTSKSGVAKTYQADPTSISNVNDMLSAYVGAQATPAGFYWVAEDNTKVPFTYADLQGLAAAMGAQGWAAFQNLQAKKTSIKSATTVPAVQAVTWS
jgi:hypothetical protein